MKGLYKVYAKDSITNPTAATNYKTLTILLQYGIQTN